MNRDKKSTIEYLALWLSVLSVLISASIAARQDTPTLPPVLMTEPPPIAAAERARVPEAVQALPVVPLDAELINTVVAACDIYSVPIELAFAVMEVESGYTVNAVNGACVGLYQINTEYIAAYEDALGITDIYEPMQNIESGVWYLGQLLGKHSEVNLALMHYNLGIKADRLWREGIHSTDYTDKVNAALKRLKGEV